MNYIIMWQIYLYYYFFVVIILLFYIFFIFVLLLFYYHVKISDYYTTNLNLLFQNIEKQVLLKSQTTHAKHFSVITTTREKALALQIFLLLKEPLNSVSLPIRSIFFFFFFSIWSHLSYVCLLSKSNSTLSRYEIIFQFRN